MAPKVEKFQSAGKGNGLRAISLVYPGEVLYIAEPFAYTVNTTGLGRYCEFCLWSKDLLQCSQCKVAKYCCKQCQVAAWPDHKRECKCLKMTTRSTFGFLETRLAGMIVLKMLQRSRCASEELYSMSELETNYEKLSTELKTQFQLATTMLQLYQQPKIPNLAQLPADIKVTDLFAILYCNPFTITNGALQNVAGGLYPSMSLLNHSCEPNCIVVSMGRLLHLRAIRKIQAGEELTIAYIDTLMITEERQSQLRKQYSFECDCHWCQTCYMDEKMLAGDKQASDETKDLAETVEKLQLDKLWVESLALCNAQLQRNKGRVPDENIYQMKILNYAMEACVALKLLDQAVHYGTRTLEPLRLYTSGTDAIRALNMIDIANMLFEQGKTCKAATLYRKAVEDMKLFYGLDHSLTKDLVRTIEDLEFTLALKAYRNQRPGQYSMH